MKNLMVQWALMANMGTLFLGFSLAENFGFYHAIFALFIGNALLFLLGVLVLQLIQNKPTTMDILAQRSMGYLGSYCVSMALIMCLGGWFALQNKINASILSSLCHLPESFCLLLLGIISTICVSFGIKGLEKYSYFIVFFIIIKLFTLDLFKLENRSILNNLSQINKKTFDFKIILNAIFFICYGCFGWIFDLPTYFSLVKKPSQRFFNLATLCFIILPAFELIGVFIFQYYPGKSLNDALFHKDSFLIINILFVIFSCFGANNGNLFSVVMNTPFKNNLKLKSFLFGFLFTGLSFLDFTKNTENFLEKINILNLNILTMVLLQFFTHYTLPKKYSFLIFFVSTFISTIISTNFYPIKITSFLILDILCIQILGALLFYSRSLLRKI